MSSPYTPGRTVSTSPKVLIPPAFVLRICWAISVALPPVYDYLDTVRGSAHAVCGVGVILIGSDRLHTLHVLQNGALDAFKHRRGAVVNLISVGLPELDVGLCQASGDVRTYVGYRLQTSYRFHNLCDDAVRDEGIAVVHRSKLDDAGYRFGGQILGQHHRVGACFVGCLNSEPSVCVVHLEGIVRYGGGKCFKGISRVQLAIKGQRSGPQNYFRTPALPPPC